MAEIETEEFVDDAESYETGFVVDDDKKADWALKKIKEIKKETEEWTNFYESKKQKIISANEMRESNLLEKLRAFFQTLEKTKETKTQFSYELPGGKLVLKKGKSDFAVSDKKTLAEQLKNTHPELVQTKTEPKWADIKKGLQRLDGNKIAYISDDGEVIEVQGVEIANTPERFEVK